MDRSEVPRTERLTVGELRARERNYEARLIKLEAGGRGITYLRTLRGLGMLLCAITGVALSSIPALMLVGVVGVDFVDVLLIAFAPFGALGGLAFERRARRDSRRASLSTASLRHYEDLETKLALTRAKRRELERSAPTRPERGGVTIARGESSGALIDFSPT